MRTTIDLPEDLLQQAKVAAAERGIPLRELVSEAISKLLAIAFVVERSAAKPFARGRIGFSRAECLSPAGEGDICA